MAFDFVTTTNKGSILQFDMRIEGAKELQKALGKFSDGVQKRAVKKGTRGATKEIVRKQVLLNLERNRRTGRHTDPLIRYFKRKGSVRAIRRNRSGYIGWRLEFPGRIEVGIDDIDPWYYPAHIELGSKKTPATPYLRPAIHDSEAAALSRVARDMKTAIEDERKRAEIKRRGG